MTMLLELPDHLVTSILAFWLDIGDVGRLDSAMCNQKQREKYKQIAYHNSQPFSTHHLLDFTTKHGSEFVQNINKPAVGAVGVSSWAVVRRAAITSFAFPRLTPQGMTQDEILTLSTNADIYFQTAGKYIEQMVFSEFLIPLIKHCPKVRAILFPPGCNEQDYFLIGSAWPSLQSFSMGYGTTELCLMILGAHCPRIECLNAIDMYSSQSGFQTFLEQHGSYLQQLSLPAYMEDAIAEAGRLATDAILTVARHCPKLRCLRAKCLTVPVGSLEELLQGCSDLTELSLEGCSFNPKHAAVLAQLGTRLAALDLMNNNELTDGCMVDLLYRCPNLRRLNMAYTAIGGSTMAAIGQHCARLEELELFVFANSGAEEALYALARGCPALQTVRLFGSGVTEAGLIELMTQCPRITHLLVRGTCITDASLLVLPQLLPGLVELDINGTGVTVVGVTALIQGCCKLKRVLLPFAVRGMNAAEKAAAGLIRPGLRLLQPLS